MPELLRINDDTTREEIAEALTNLARHAMRLPHVLDNSPHQRCHAQMDALLDDWEHAPTREDA